MGRALAGHRCYRPDGGKTSYAYNRENKLTKITNPLGAVTGFELDPPYYLRPPNYTPPAPSYFNQAIQRASTYPRTPAQASQNQVSATHTGFWTDPHFWIITGIIVVSVAAVVVTAGFAAPEVAVADTAAIGGEAAAIAAEAAAAEAAAASIPSVTEVTALVPEGYNLATWGKLIWGRADDGATSLIGSRSAAELSKIPGLTADSAATLRDFYQGATNAGKGGATAPIRVELLNDIIRTLNGG